jgi:predicted mannosyl-3-phosphoglycerate phosphatase (HAD superfamily)
MTEKEVKKQETEVERTSVEVEFEQQWINAELEALTNSEKRLALAWKFHKLMRNDEQMQATYTDLVKVRAGVVGLRERLAQLTTPSAPTLAE